MTANPSNGLTLRDLDGDDLAWLLALNQACLPAVSSLDATSLTRLLAEASLARLAALDDERLGALIAFRPGADYGSDNYRWFCAAYDDFLYVDRVMVSGAARGRGVGAALYEDAAETAQRLGVPRLTCEVNEEPPNPGSMRFHERLGFEAVESRPSAGGRKRVAMLARPIGL